MKSKLTAVVVFLAGILTGAAVAHQAMLQTPQRDAVREAGNAIIAHYKAHGSLPNNLSEIPNINQNTVNEYGISFDKHSASIQSSLETKYYDTSILYALTHGLIGDRVTYTKPGWDISKQVR